jgi:hypothetical protein
LNVQRMVRARGIHKIEPRRVSTVNRVVIVL